MGIDRDVVGIYEELEAKNGAMITAIGIEGFKTLEKVSLTLGHFNFLSGTNASGKSNFIS